MDETIFDLVVADTWKKATFETATDKLGKFWSKITSRVGRDISYRHWTVV